MDQQKITYQSDLVDVATVYGDVSNGHLAAFGDGNNIVDSGSATTDLVTKDNVSQVVDAATTEIWNAVNGVYAICAYSASDWETGTRYLVGGYCQHEGIGYRCVAEHTAGADFDEVYWDVVLTPSGKLAIATMLTGYSKDGLAALIDLAPVYDGGTSYVVGQMAVKDDVLQVCEKAGRGPAATFSRNATVEASIVTRIATLADSIPTKVSDLENDAHFIDGSTVNAAFDTSEHGYSEGDTCSHDGKFFVCIAPVAKGSEWNADAWTERTFKDIVGSTIQSSESEIWDAVNGAYAIAAYSASEWTAGTSYDEGAFCRHDDAGYRCIESHESTSKFDDGKWTLVLTASGRLYVDAMLSAYSKDGLAALGDLAPAYDADADYSVGNLVVLDGVLQVCTKSGHGHAAVFARNATVEASIVTRIATLADSIPTKVSDLENDDDFTPSGAIVPSYDTSSHGYAIGDTCSHGAKFYVCQRDVSQGAEWSEDDWIEKLFKDLIVTSTQEQANWTETDITKPSYIKNKPSIPSQVVIDDTLKNSGQAADAKVVGDALSSVLTEDSVRFDIQEIVPSSVETTVVSFQLLDRTLNIINYTVSAGQSILLIPPSQPSSSIKGKNLARDFYVVLNINANSDVTISVRRSSVQDATGNVVALTAPAGKVASFRLVDTDIQSSIFLISGYGDAAHSAVNQIESALDEILKDSGAYIYDSGMYLPDEEGKYHEVKIVTDSITGEKNLGVEQEGVEK